MSPTREAALSGSAVVAGGLVVLPNESAFGVAVLAGVGAAALVGPAARRAVAALVLLLGAGILAVGVSRVAPDLLVGGVAVVVGAGLAVVRGGRWHRSRRAPGDDGHERADRQRADPTAKDTWTALDRGEDPTA